MKSIETLITEIQNTENLNTLEVFESIYTETTNDFGDVELDLNSGELKGWFYWFSLPGCLPDSEPFGPFETKYLALEDALDVFGD